MQGFSGGGSGLGTPCYSDAVSHIASPKPHWPQKLKGSEDLDHPPPSPKKNLHLHVPVSTVFL